MINNVNKRKSIRLVAAIAIGIGGMIGAGIFSVLGVACQIAGNMVYISFIIAGLIALLCTYSYAKLGSTFPSAGGPVEFLIKGFGDNVLSGGLNFLLWIGYIFALALYAKAFGGYAATFVHNASQGIYINIFASVIIIVFTSINFIGTKAVGKSEVIIVAIKLVILIIFATLGLYLIKPNMLAFSMRPDFSNILFGAGIVFLAYEGFGLITNAAEDMNNPKVLLPKALYLSVFIVIVIYISVCLAVVGNLPVAQIIKAKDYTLAAAAKPLLGMIGFKIIVVAALFSTSSAINATLYGGANVSYIIAKQGQLPEFFERKVWRGGTEGLLITSGLVLVFANFLNLEGIAMLGSASFLLIYSAVNIAHLKLYRQTNAKLYIIWMSIIGCMLALGYLIYYEIRYSLETLIVLISAIVFSFVAEWIYRQYTRRPLKSRDYHT
jgi:amino acid transporter